MILFGAKWYSIPPPKSVGYFRWLVSLDFSVDGASEDGKPV